jgi:hypothetical protein
MKERYKKHQRRLYIAKVICDPYNFGVNPYKDVLLKSRRSYLDMIRKKEEDIIEVKSSIYFEVHFSETKNIGEFQGKKGYFYKILSILNFSEVNPVKFHIYNSESELRKDIKGFGEIVKITRVTNMQPLVL